MSFFLKSTSNNDWKITRIRLNRKALKKPPISNPPTSIDANITITALMTKLKRPRVKIFIGKVKSNSSGFMVAFKSPNITTRKSAVQKPVTMTPGIR